MGKKALQKRIIKEDGEVHYRSCAEQYGQTLCGCDGLLGMEDTNKPVTCRQCEGIVRYIYQHRKPPVSQK